MCIRDSEYPLVALHDLRQVLLHHQGLGTVAVQRLDDAAQVEAVARDTEDAHPAHAVQGLENDVAVLGMELPHVGLAAGDQGGRNELGKFQDGQFFRVVTQRAGPVEHLCTLPFGLPEEMSGVEVLAVKRRILAHQHRIHIAQDQPGVRDATEPVVGFAGEHDLACLHRHRFAALPTQISRFTGQKDVAAPGRLAHHRESGILVNLERLQRVGDKEQLQSAFS